MYAPAPQINTISIQTNDYEKLQAFYNRFGILFTEKESVDDTRSCIYKSNGFQFELVEVNDLSKITKNLRLSILIDEIDGYLEDITNYGGMITKKPWESDQYLHVECLDPGGNLIELITGVIRS